MINTKIIELFILNKKMETISIISSEKSINEIRKEYTDIIEAVFKKDWDCNELEEFWESIRMRRDWTEINAFKEQIEMVERNFSNYSQYLENRANDYKNRLKEDVFESKVNLFAESDKKKLDYYYDIVLNWYFDQDVAFDINYLFDDLYKTDKHDLLIFLHAINKLSVEVKRIVANLKTFQKSNINIQETISHEIVNTISN